MRWVEATLLAVALALILLFVCAVRMQLQINDCADAGGIPVDRHDSFINIACINPESILEH